MRTPAWEIIEPMVTYVLGAGASYPLTQQMLEALTVGGGPCEGKNPLPADSN
jgi:hypothetical protein